MFDKGAECVESLDFRGHDEEEWRDECVHSLDVADIKFLMLIVAPYKSIKEAHEHTLAYALCEYTITRECSGGMLHRSMRDVVDERTETCRF